MVYFKIKPLNNKINNYVFFNKNLLCTEHTIRIYFQKLHIKHIKYNKSQHMSIKITFFFKITFSLKLSFFSRGN